MSQIRVAKICDLEAIVGIYNQAVVSLFQTGDTTEWVCSERRPWLEGHACDTHPVYVYEADGQVVGWLSLSPYRPGREALRYTSEVSYFVDKQARGRGIGTRLLQHALDQGPNLGIKTMFAIVLDKNVASVHLLEKLGFALWGHLPNVADFKGHECGHLYYGKRLGVGSVEQP